MMSDPDDATNPKAAKPEQPGADQRVKADRDGRFLSDELEDTDRGPARRRRVSEGEKIGPGRRKRSGSYERRILSGSIRAEDSFNFSSRRTSILKQWKTLLYEEELKCLQVEMVRLQRWVQSSGQRIAILVEGRDAAGKGGTIRRFTEHLNPRAMRVVALPRPTEQERGQWYFQRYIQQLPNKGEIVFFDRSWYNRAVVEPVMGFCTKRNINAFSSRSLN